MDVAAVNCIVSDLAQELQRRMAAAGAAPDSRQVGGWDCVCGVPRTAAVG